ncbi:hypothetical protein [Eleftheria terrae]|uniref:hypothetical protein n=1 Tax=Eleftheria terrae TaxID=1597781 RepID=UPI00263A8C09|nr:hypothetical protein [Eleftheria terrae]WKB55510.1 hypothetical protein N7L95_25885 [Eleftheria terrae]
MATALPRGGYAPRDVLNAPALKAAIDRRSRARCDAEPVREWLLNHFFRHVVGNLQAPPPAVQPVSTLAQARQLLAPAALPPWVSKAIETRKAAASPALWWVDPEGAELLALELRLVEFLGSRQGTPLEGKLMRVNGPQAIALWAAEHAAIEAQADAGWRRHQPEAVRQVWQGRHGVFVELLPHSPGLRAEMAYESQLMRHCLGQFANRKALQGGYGEHYAAACESGRLRLFSYRSLQQQPHITISAWVGAQDGRLAIDQIKGKQNRPPVSRYQEEVIGFLNSLDTTADTPPDAAGMGVVRLQRGWCPVSQAHDAGEQLQLVKRYPALVQALPQPSALVQWLVAARQPELLKGLALAPGVAQALEQGR